MGQTKSGLDIFMRIITTRHVASHSTAEPGGSSWYLAGPSLNERPSLCGPTTCRGNHKAPVLRGSSSGPKWRPRRPELFFHLLINHFIIIFKFFIFFIFILSF
ncbi:hypothetical protein GOODEAATRI_020978 [Goodea atripinnis]|uniref:Uncharacterized protein n=1 Tax=Goodea atripinnis TaxID=208336 RepID=A0ABV0MJH0_9TELE